MSRVINFQKEFQSDLYLSLNQKGEMEDFYEIGISEEDDEIPDEWMQEKVHDMYVERPSSNP